MTGEDMEGGQMSEEDLPDDYLSAAAAVVEAARKLDTARRKFQDAQNIMLTRHSEQAEAERELREALEKLSQTSSGRHGRSAQRR